MAGRLTATVIGGGIAGFTAAASLVRAGWRVTVLERADAFGEVGAGLAITANGMAALDALGAGDRVRAVGHSTFGEGAQDYRGRWLLRVPGADTQAVYVLWAVHRQRLHNALLACAEGAELVTGAQVLSVQPGVAGSEPAITTWRTGTQEHTGTSDLVVAADGIRSRVRTQLFPRVRLRYSGRTSWRAVIDGSDTVGEGFAGLWGPQTEFGALRISDREVYWYGYFRHPAGSSFDDELGVAISHFSGWPPGVRALVAATPPNRLMRHDVYHLPHGLPTYVRGRVVLVGDAAHAMLPTMGQGANTSLEDGVCVGRLVAEPVAEGIALAPALAAFDRARRPRCRRIARQSLLTARFGAHVGGGWPQTLRNAVVRHVPAGPLMQAGAEALRWTPPERQPLRLSDDPVPG